MSKKQNAKTPPNKDILERINFLSEAAKLSAQDSTLVNLSQHFGAEAHLIALKSKIRIRPQKIFCKNCKTALVAPLTATVTKTNNCMIYKCKLCQSQHRIYLSEKKK